MDANAPDTLLCLRDAAPLGLRPATVKQDIQKGQLAAVRVLYGHATRLYVTHVEIDRYRCASLGAQGWDKRRRHAPSAPTDEPGARYHAVRGVSLSLPRAPLKGAAEIVATIAPVAAADVWHCDWCSSVLC